MVRMSFGALSCLIFIAESLATSSKILSPQPDLSRQYGRVSHEVFHPMTEVGSETNVVVSTSFVDDEPWMDEQEIRSFFCQEISRAVAQLKISLTFDGKSFEPKLASNCEESFNESVHNTVEVCRKKYDQMMENLCEANARITSLASEICDLRLDSHDLESAILERMGRFIAYYKESPQSIQDAIKDNQDLIDCLGMIACLISPDTGCCQCPELSEFFTEITTLSMTKLSGKRILEDSDGELAYNFIASGGLDDIG